jgi:hypothetical protein
VSIKSSWGQWHRASGNQHAVDCMPDPTPINIQLDTRNLPSLAAPSIRRTSDANPLLQESFRVL